MTLYEQISNYYWLKECLGLDLIRIFARIDRFYASIVSFGLRKSILSTFRFKEGY